MPTPMMTCRGIDVRDALFDRYLQSLIGRFYKILPLREANETTLDQYMVSLQREMLGFQQLIVAMQDDDRYMSLLAILQSLIDNSYEISIVKADVFRAINTLKQLRAKYTKE